MSRWVVIKYRVVPHIRKTIPTLRIGQVRNDAVSMLPASAKTFVVAAGCVLGYAVRVEVNRDACPGDAVSGSP